MNKMVDILHILLKPAVVAVCFILIFEFFASQAKFSMETRGVLTRINNKINDNKNKQEGINTEVSEIKKQLYTITSLTEDQRKLLAAEELAKKVVGNENDVKELEKQLSQTNNICYFLLALLITFSIDSLMRKYRT
jgi:peptidoglycan hydrolase CwlO-like protein